MKVQGRRKSGRHKRRWLGKVKDYIKGKGQSPGEVYDRSTWRHMSSYIDHTSKSWNTIKRKKRKKHTKKWYNEKTAWKCITLDRAFVLTLHSSAERR